jgi:hypothetical protein
MRKTRREFLEASGAFAATIAGASRVAGGGRQDDVLPRGVTSQWKELP